MACPDRTLRLQTDGEWKLVIKMCVVCNEANVLVNKQMKKITCGVFSVFSCSWFEN